MAEAKQAAKPPAHEPPASMVLSFPDTGGETRVCSDGKSHTLRKIMDFTIELRHRGWKGTREELEKSGRTAVLKLWDQSKPQSEAMPSQSECDAVQRDRAKRDHQ